MLVPVPALHTEFSVPLRVTMKHNLVAGMVSHSVYSEKINTSNAIINEAARTEF